MRAPSSAHFLNYSRFLIIFLLGLLLGSLIFLYMHGKMIDRLLTENKELLFRNSNLSQENKKLEEELSQKTKQKLTIKKIELKVVGEGEEQRESFTKIEVLERLRRDLQFLIGLPLESVAETADSILQLVNGKRYTINQQEVSLQVEALIIYTTITVKVSLISSSG